MRTDTVSSKLAGILYLYRNDKDREQHLSETDELDHSNFRIRELLIQLFKECLSIIIRKICDWLLPFNHMKIETLTAKGPPQRGLRILHHSKRASPLFSKLKVYQNTSHISNPRPAELPELHTFPSDTTAFCP